MAFVEKNKKDDKEKVFQLPNKNNPMNERDRLKQLEEFAQQTIQVINVQGNALQAAMSKISQLSFRLGKMDEELHIVRIASRIQKDKLNTVLKTLSELGFIDENIFNIFFSNIETKYLPINTEGQINGNIMMKRYNPPDDIPHPEHMMQV